jgi:hypothetical protein
VSDDDVYRDDYRDDDDGPDEPRVSRRLWGYAIGASVFSVLVIGVFLGSHATETVAHTGCWIHEPPSDFSACIAP